jgi:3D (Asp-Asp-Asp) domain-containing protein
MLLTRSLKRRIAVVAGAALGFVLLYEGTTFDSHFPALRTTSPPASPGPAATMPKAARSQERGRVRFRATAYCKGRTTTSGATVRSGIAAGDPDQLPVGSVIRVDGLGARYNGIYTIMDTGPRVQGSTIDIYMWSCHEALRFGRRRVYVTVLRHGWSPRATDAAALTTAPAPSPAASR